MPRHVPYIVFTPHDTRLAVVLRRLELLNCSILNKLMYNRPQFSSRKKEPDMGVDPDGFSPIEKVNEMCDSPS